MRLPRGGLPSRGEARVPRSGASPCEPGVPRPQAYPPERGTLDSPREGSPPRGKRIPLQGACMSGFVYVIYLAITVYAWLIVARALMSWLHPRTGTAVYRVNAVLVDVTEPFLGLFRRVIPVARMGGTGVDLSAVVATSGSWSRVAVPGQPTPRDSRGYPGWVPTRQLTAVRPQTGRRLAVIRRPTAWTWETPSLTGRVLELSYGTRLPAVAWTPSSVQVAMLDGRSLYLKRSAVALRSRVAAVTQPTGAQLVADARRFLGLQYLWAGMSGFGFDCSGFTCLVYQALGVTIPRDGAPQSAEGVKVARTSLRAGDLVFFRSSSGQIHHVGMYVGNGRMIHAPATGLPVSVVSLSEERYSREFAGGRRYVP